MTETQIKLYRCDEIFCIADDEEGNLGEGSYGRVRLGFHQNYGAIAVKCSEMKGGKRERILLEKRIKKEIGHLQQANHENIVRVYGWTHWSGAIAIIMEYLPAGNLKAILLDEDVVLGPLLRARFAEEIANGLAFIHNLFDDKRLLHGDIKPENILMTEDLHCKIGDFGAAQLSNYTGSTTTAGYKDLKSVQLTKLYAAPERLQNISMKLTPKCDTYSFGMTLHMILAREPPIDFGIPVQTFIDRIIEGQRPSLESIQTYIRELEAKGQSDDAAMIQFLKEEMIRCWEKNSADRLTMTEVNEHLQSQLRNRDLNVFHKLVYDASKTLCLKKPSFVQDENLPISRFCPPRFLVDAPGMSSTKNAISINYSTFVSEITDSSGESHRNQSRSSKSLDQIYESASAEALEPSMELIDAEPEIKDTITVSPTSFQSSHANTSTNNQIITGTSANLGKLHLGERFEQDEETFSLSQKEKSDLEECLKYLKTCGLLDNTWNEEVVEVAKEKLQIMNEFFDPRYQSKLFKKNIVLGMLRQDAITLFLQYLKLLIVDGKVYPRESIFWTILENIKLLIGKIAYCSVDFCVECGK
ncbi:receptor-interacting serine/threonine-protein kinase 4-like isoform X1 [Clavelina lepadiformis]|uniref:receptor-interacting serine/threonine-protein kinase 4-like isoform X1 n=2 Tax=Clavelina lepadiformis TaxID=159417 RepID=UPI004042EA18